MKRTVSFGIITVILSFIIFLAGCSKKNEEPTTTTENQTTTTNNSEITTTINTTTTVVKKDYSINVNKVSKDISSQEIIEKNNKEYIKNGSSYTMNLSIVVEKNGNKKDFQEEITLSIIDKDSKSLDMQIESANSSMVNSLINEEYWYTKSDISYTIPNDMDSFEVSIELLLRCNRDIEIEADFIELSIESDSMTIDIPKAYEENICATKDNYLSSDEYCLYEEEYQGYKLYCKYGYISRIPDQFCGCDIVAIDNNIADYEHLDSNYISKYDNAYYIGNTYNQYMVLVKALDKNIASCEISSHCIQIHQYAFSECLKLKEITILDSVKTIGLGAFYGCSITKMTLSFIGESKTNNTYLGYIFGAPSYDLNSKFVPSSLEEIVISNGCERIGNNAFYNCFSIENVRIPDSVTAIGESAFYSCGNLTKIVIPNYVADIGSNAFYGCSSLMNITIPDSVTTIGPYAFYNCPIKEATFPIHVLSYIPNTKLENVIITSGEIIESYAFLGCNSLTSISIPNSITSISKYAFSGCDNLQLNSYDNGLYLGNSETPYLYLYKMSNRLITTCEISDQCKIIDDSVLSDCDNLVSITILKSALKLPESLPILTKYGYAFKGWYTDSSLTNKAISGSAITNDTTIYTKWERLYSYTDSTKTSLYFGTYPQTQVEANNTNGLSSIAFDETTWKDYGYYISGSVQSYMYYYDVDTNNDDAYDYRGVYFTKYRPNSIEKSSSSNNSYQDDNNYNTDTIYWFSYDPIKWNIIGTSSSQALIISELILDSQDYNYTTSSKTEGGNTIYANNYMYSHIRSWLNDTFYNTAFNDLEKQLIETEEVDNSASSTGISDNKCACANTNDKIFLLSYQEETSYYTTAKSRQANPTAYAKIQGISTDSSYSGKGSWWLRSPYYSWFISTDNINDDEAYYVNEAGSTATIDIRSTNYGICAACVINL